MQIRKNMQEFCNFWGLAVAKHIFNIYVKSGLNFFKINSTMNAYYDFLKNKKNLMTQINAEKLSEN